MILKYLINNLVLDVQNKMTIFSWSTAINDKYTLHTSSNFYFWLRNINY